MYDSFQNRPPLNRVVVQRISASGVKSAVSKIVTLPIARKKELIDYFSAQEGWQTRYAKHLSPLAGNDEIDLALRNLAWRLGNTERGFRFPESMQEYASIFWVKDPSVLGIIIAIRWETLMGPVHTEPKKVKKQPTDKRQPPQERRFLQEESLAIAHAWKAHFIWVISSLTKADRLTFSGIHFERTLANKRIEYTYQRSGVTRKGMVQFWNTFLTEQTIEWFKQRGYDILQEDARIRFVREEGEWKHVFLLPLGVRITSDIAKMKQLEAVQTTILTTKPSDSIEVLAETKKAKQEFCNILENLLSSKGIKPERWQRWTRKPKDFHLKFNWDIGFHAGVDTDNKVIRLKYSEWAPTHLNYGKSALWLLEKEEFELSTCSVTGKFKKRVITYTATNGWNISFSLA